MKKLIVATNSPRRKQLMREAGFDFEVFTLEISEEYPDELPSKDVAKYLAKFKNQEYRKSLTDEVVMTADTVVLLSDQILGKPEDRVEAIQMLRLLSGRPHQVITGVCISDSEKTIEFDDCTDVYFRKLEENEIAHYVDKYKPFDKAGSYGIQEWIGMIGIEKIAGCFYNVMGLPIRKIYQSLLTDFEIEVN